jgi:flagellar biosynthetic protein FlhB
MPDQKTEQPTQRRLDKARKEGRFPISREFVSACQFIVFVCLIQVYGGEWFRSSRTNLRAALAAGFRPDLTLTSVVNLFWTLAKANLIPLLMAGLGLCATVIAAQLFTTGLGISLNKLAPDVARLNPLSKIKQLPQQNLPAFVQALLLLPVFTIAVWAIVSENLVAFAKLPLTATYSGAQKVADSLLALLWRAAFVFAVFGIVDLFRQRRRHASELRMTKQEIRDEMKETDGNPLIKQRIRRIQRDLARRTMMREVPKATAVIVNPTHYSVAIRYAVDSPGAPVVLAKGKNYLARRIREIALEHNVPIVENQPLAQALYKSVDVGQEIPAHLYRAVAEILAYIFKLMNGRLPG